MKKRMRRLVAVLLATAMVVQQGSTLGVSAVETEPVTEASAITAAETQASESETKAEAQISENETKAPETKASESETKAPETKASESETKVPETKASESETKAPETKASESETKAPEIKSSESETKAETQVSESETKAPETQASESETKAETQTSESGTKETELKPQTDETATESESDPAAAEKTMESETATEQATETEQVSETVTETELSTEEETTAKAEAELEAEVTQEVFQQTTEDAVVPMVKYTVKLTNKTADADAEGISLKVVLDGFLSYKKQDGESLQLVNFDTLANAVNAAALGNVVLSEEQKAVYADGSVVVWNDQTVAGGTEKEFVFFAEVKDGETDVNALRNLWFVNDEAVKDEQIKWVNAELLEVKKELPSEFVCEGEDGMIVTATLSDPSILPEGAQFVVKKVELTDEEIAQIEATAEGEKQLANYAAYDMHFELDGVEVEPQGGTVSVKIAYEKTNDEDFGGETLNADAAELQVIHLDEQTGAEDVTTGAEVNAKGAVDSAEFVTDSFSVFVLSQMVDVDRTFVYEDDDVKITAVVDEDEEVLNSNLAKLKMEIVEDRDSKEYKKLEKAVKEAEKTNTKVLLGFRAYSFMFLKDGEEIEPTGEIEVTIKHKNSVAPENISENLIDETTFYQMEQKGKATPLDARVKTGSHNMAKEAVMTISSDTLIETIADETTDISRDSILADLGITRNFAVFAKYFNNDNHMEGSVAVQYLMGNSSHLGNTNKVSEYNKTSSAINISKTVEGEGAGTEFKFGVYQKDANGNYQLVQSVGTDGVVTVTTTDGKGSVSLDKLSAGTYYVFELDDSNQPILTNGTAKVNGKTVTVSYTSTEAENSAVIGGVGNTSYIEFFEGEGNKNSELFNDNQYGKATLVMGSTNTLEIVTKEEESGRYVKGHKGAEYLVNLDKTIVSKAEEPFPIQFDTILGNLSALPAKLEKATTNNSVKVVHVPIKGGTTDNKNVVEYLQNGTTQKPFENDENAWSNTGLNTDGKLLIFNVDCTDASNGVTLKGMKINGQDPQNWNDVANSVIWNFYTKSGDTVSAYKGSITYEGGLGTILAPAATVKCTSSTNGSVIGTTVSHPSCEIHHIQLQKSMTETTITKSVECKNTVGGVLGTDVTFEGTKTIEGIGNSDKEFTFELYETGEDYKISNGKSPLRTATRKGAGAYKFSKIKYTNKGTHYYVVKEKASTNAEGFIFDAKIYEIKVEVNEKEGQLEKTVTVKDVTGENPEKKLDFVNTYKAASTDVIFGGTKFITGVDSTDAVFTFELYETADNKFDITGVMPKTKSTSGTITGSQTYSFDKITYTEAGTHYYVVKEKVLDKANGFTTDATVYQITVDVKDDGKGHLTRTVSVKTSDGKSATETALDFTNKASTTTFSLDAVKRMADATAALGTFEFEVTDETGKVLATAKNDETGKVAFGDIATYKLDDIGKTFTYTVKEKNPQTADGTIYDKTVYTVTVTVIADKTTGAPAAETEIKKDGAAADAIEFVNDVTHLSILKVDESGAALAGAKLVLKDAAGNLIDSWTTDGKSHDITGLAKGSYTLSEIEAPEGYRVSKDIPVEITDAAGSAAPLTVTMTDTTIPKSDKRSLTVTKHLRLDGITSDVGIKDAVYYVALFSDEAKTQRVSDVKPVVFKNSTASSVTFENLAKGTYYVGETDENGTLLLSKMVNDKVIFYPEYDATAKVEFEGGRSETASAEFTNVYVELTSGLYLSGQLTVTKKVLLNGAEGTSDETYYARVFFDKAMTSPASDVLALDLAGGTSASVTVTDLYIGETIGSSATYYVAETDKNGTPLDPDAVTEFEISIDKSEIVMDANNSVQEVVITNSYTEEETETETETETEVDEKKTAPKTGDDTDFMRYLLLMALSAGTCAAAFDRKRRGARRVEK